MNSMSEVRGRNSTTPMLARIAVDTNILIYAERLSADPLDRHITAATLAAGLVRQGQLVIPAQVFGEFIAVMERKAGLPRADAVASAAAWRDDARLAPTDAASLDGAMMLAAGHGLTIWDALVLGTAAAHDCTLLLTEDLHDGFVWRGCTVADPFAAVRHPLLASLLP